MRGFAAVVLLAGGLVLGGLAACVGEVNVEDVSFPCRTPEDCAEGFVCAEDRFVCVASDQPTPTDAGVQQDANSLDAANGDSSTIDLGL